MNAVAPVASLCADQASPQPSRQVVAAAMAAAVDRIAPLWPLDGFVAVNPYLGLVDRTPHEAAAVLAAAGAGAVAMPRSFYAAAIARGRITPADLEEAVARAGAAVPLAAADLMRASREEAPAVPSRPTVASVAGGDWTRLVVERIGAWAAARFDRGQAAWAPAWRELGDFAAWRRETMVDRTPDALGLRGVRDTVRRLPDDHVGATVAAVVRLGLSAEGLESYFHRALSDLLGWAGVLRARAWEARLRGEEDDGPAQLLAVRVAWDSALLDALRTPDIAAAWAGARSIHDEPPMPSADSSVDLLLQGAYEIAWQRDLLERIGRGRCAPVPPSPVRPSLQAAFCIDVRSEPMRRALEHVDPAIETLGFAGFFGVPAEVIRLGETRAEAHCPVLLRPGVVVTERVRGDGGDERRALARAALRQAAAGALAGFRRGAVGAFGFVETLGLGYAARLAADSLGLAAKRTPSAARPCLEPDTLGHGIAPETRHVLARGILRGMSLVSGFAPVVLLVGHGGSSVNNPHAAGLHCGACGGRTGEASARLAAALLNDASVRARLVADGIAIPGDTVFVAALHDTTTDRVRIDDDGLPPESAAWIAGCFERAGATVRRERAPRLGIVHDASERDVVARSRDWSQVRPEWALAGCAAFIAAPRARTRDIDLGGRAFLHTYDWRIDRDFKVLELIMTAPMVVASWISLQYLGSVADNRRMGAGDKTLHNVTGKLGVVEGNGGDLRPGLPLQSLSDGVALAHEPMRLTVLIEAPVEAIAEVVARHAHVRDLLDNGWLHLHALDTEGGGHRRYLGGGLWEPKQQAGASYGVEAA